MNNKAIIAMSGGVDSSVAALLMKMSGYELMGITLKLLSVDVSNSADAKTVSESMGFPHAELDMSDEFKAEVIDRFIDAYEHCRTPNPCIFCNRHIKFGKLIDYAIANGFSNVATGHYARICKENGRYLLKKGFDPMKDQSYVLYTLTQKQLSHTLFPLGEFDKSAVRAIAVENGFVSASKRESQDICFVPDGDYAAFIEAYLGKTYKCGNFTDFDGNILGRHKGLIRYTIGQRKGLGLSLPKPMYVCSLCPENNTVVLGDNNDLFSKSLYASDINLIATDRIESAITAEVKVRYSHKPQPAKVWQTADDELHIEFLTPQRAITSGQAVVLYDGDTVIGGGTIN